MSSRKKIFEKLDGQTAKKKALSMIGMAKRAGKLAVGEQACEIAIKKKSAYLVIIAQDASQNTAKKFMNSCYFYQIESVLWGTKEEIGNITGGWQTAVTAVTDQGFAKSIVNFINQFRATESGF